MGAEQMTLVRMIDAASDLVPEKTALIGPEGSLTYRELQQRSLVLAQKLAWLLGKPEPQKAVCLMVGKGAMHVICALAVLRAGHFFVSVDTAYPDERIHHVLEKTDAALLITTARMADEHRLHFPENKTILVEQLNWDEEAAFLDRSVPEGVFDLIFTSGTTGTPKGVIRPHSAVATAVRHTGLPFSAGDVFLTISSVTFAVALFDTFLPLTLGATVCLLADRDRRNIASILDAIQSRNVTAMFATPQLGIGLLDNWHAGLPKIVFAGDIIRNFHAPGTRVFNAYGMSEFVMVGMVEIRDGQASSLPLCRPFDDVAFRIVDESGRDVPEGGKGELWIRGPECFGGYLGDPDLTARKMAGGWFHSGDTVRLGPDGLLYFVNRSPDMIKINGQRIAPCEVETVAIRRCGFRDAACALKPVGGTDQLCLYYTGEQVAEETIRRKLAEVLAPYMVPAICIHLDKLPLNANMKIDRAALPDPETALSTESVPPSNSREALLLAIAQKILSRTDFGVTDRLRVLGLTSLHAMTMVAEAETQGITLKLSDLIKYDTIRGLANARMSVGYLDGGFDPDRPTVALVCGITAYTSLTELCTALKERFNLCVIEPTAAHYRYIFRDADMNEAALFYSDWLDHLLNGQRISAFIGHCFGGEMAFRVASAWQKRHPGDQTVLLLDSPWHDKPDVALYELLHGIIPESQINFWLVQNRKDIVMINSLACPGVPEFHGRIIYYRAMTAIRDEPANQPIVQSLSPEGRQRFRDLVAEQGGAFGMIDPDLWRDKAKIFELHELDTTHRGMLKGEWVRQYVDQLASVIA